MTWRWRRVLNAYMTAWKLLADWSSSSPSSHWVFSWRQITSWHHFQRLIIWLWAFSLVPSIKSAAVWRRIQIMKLGIETGFLGNSILSYLTNMDPSMHCRNSWTVDVGCTIIYYLCWLLFFIITGCSETASQLISGCTDIRQGVFHKYT